MTKLELYGEIDESGKLTITNRPRLQEWCRQNKGKRVLLKLNRAGKKRSLPQNRYYHGVVIKEIAIRLRELGHAHLEDDEVHEMMKIKFCFEREVNENTGEVLDIPKSTTSLTTTEFCVYMDRIRDWAQDFLGIYIPSPNENLQFNFDGQ